MENIKKNQMEILKVKNTRTKIKITVDGLNGGTERKKNYNKRKNQPEQQRENKLKNEK